MTQFDDPRKELLEHWFSGWTGNGFAVQTLGWLKILQYGTRMPRTPRQQHRPTSRPASSTGATDLSGFLRRPTTPVSAPVERPTRRSMTKLEGAWGQILESRTPPLISVN